MTDTAETRQNDLEWLRSLAESGRAAPLQTGPYLVAGGTWFGGASLILSLAQLRVLQLPNTAISWIWIVSAVGFAVTLFALIRRDRGEGERGANRLINATWSAAGFGIFVFWLSTAVLALRLGQGEIMSTMAPAVLTIYGVVWWVKGSLTGVSWMHAIAALSFASSVLVAAAAGTQFVWLTYTLALAACALLPGLYLLRVGGRAA
jgi:hypothetical protein